MNDGNTYIQNTYQYCLNSTSCITAPVPRNGRGIGHSMATNNRKGGVLDAVCHIGRGGVVCDCGRLATWRFALVFPRSIAIKSQLLISILISSIDSEILLIVPCKYQVLNAKKIVKYILSTKLV